jgi:hypothetical protein
MDKPPGNDGGAKKGLAAYLYPGFSHEKRREERLHDPPSAPFVVERTRRERYRRSHVAREWLWKVTRRPHKRVHAITASIGLHLLLLMLILPQGRTGLPGAPGFTQGAGVDLALVSDASLGLAAPHLRPMTATTTSTPATPPAAEAKTAAAIGGDLAAAVSPSNAITAPSPSSESQTDARSDTGATRIAASDDDERRGARQTSGGDPNATSELLLQIAKCLPPETRPRLTAQSLILNVGPTGALTVAPMIDSSIPLVTAEDRAAADQVVQAALQCGPYDKAGIAGQTVSLAVDFSDIRPVPLAKAALPTN